MAKSSRNQIVDPVCIQSLRSLPKIWDRVPRTLLAMRHGRWINQPLTAQHIKDLEQVIFYAGEIGRWLKLYDAFSAAGNMERMITAAFQLSGYYENLCHYQDKASVRFSLARRGGQTRDKSDRAWQSQVETMMQSKGRSWTDVCKEIGKRSGGLNGRTVRRHTSDPRRKIRKIF